MKVHSKWCLTIIGLACIGLVVFISSFSRTRAAGSWYVSPDGDNGNDCLSPTTSCRTINSAIGKAGSGDTIYVTARMYTSGAAQVVLINKSVNLSGGWDETFTTQTGLSTLDGQGSRRGITVNSAVTAMAERFLIKDGYADQGGGIFVEGDLTLSESTISSNHATDSGGGIIVHFGTLTLHDSTVSDNRADRLGSGICNAYGTVTLNSSAVIDNTGVGIFNEGAATLTDSVVSGNAGGGISNADNLTVISSSINGNAVGESGSGGVYNAYDGTASVNNSSVSGNTGYGIANRGILDLYNDTVSENTGGGINNIMRTVTVQNTILSGNGVSATGPDCSGTINSSGYNLIGTLSGCTFIPSAGDLSNTDPKLGEFIGNPGYLPLLSGSPAIDAGNPAGCTGGTGPLNADQRGAARVGRCDIGAYEYTIPGPAASIYTFGGTPQITPLLHPFETPLQAAVLDNIGSPVNNATVTFSAPVSGPSGTFADSGTSTTTAATAESGIGTAAAFTANGVAGSYTVTATVSGVVTPGIFLLTNDELFEWYVANGGNNSNDCLSPPTPCRTINGAIGKAGPGDTIYVASGTYSGSAAQVVLINKSVTLSGGWDETFTTQSGFSTLDGRGLRRGITVNSDVTAIVERFAMRNGHTDSDGGGIYTAGILTLSNGTVSRNTSGQDGGGIFNTGTLTLSTSTVSGNRCDDAGGGVINDGGGTVTLNASTINNNSAMMQGGGIYNHDGTLALINSTVTGNDSLDWGGGISNDSGMVTLSNSTVSGNTSDRGGGIRNANGTVTVQNAILAGNTASEAGPDCRGAIGSLGYNLIRNTSGCAFSASSGDLLNVDAELFPLTGSPGHHALLPGSPAIDAGNPGGCVDHLGSPVDSDQRGVPRPLDGDGDGSTICDIGAYELDPDNPTSLLFLSALASNYCPDFFDDFSNPASGWAVLDDNFVRSEYLDGEYRVLSKQAGYLYLFKAPTCDRHNYVVEVDARWVGDPGGGYGLIFGLAGGFDHYYLFDVNTDFQLYRLLRRDPSGFTPIAPISPSPAINSGTASNHLKVTRYGDRITLEVNGSTLGTWTDGTITGLTGVGLVSSPYSDQPISDARFDDFAMVDLPSNGPAVRVQSRAQDGVDKSHLSDAYRDAVPAYMDSWSDRDRMGSDAN